LFAYFTCCPFIPTCNPYSTCCPFIHNCTPYFTCCPIIPTCSYTTSILTAPSTMASGDEQCGKEISNSLEHRVIRCNVSHRYIVWNTE
jgi:hypothetical protein